MPTNDMTLVDITKDGVAFASCTIRAYNLLYAPQGYWIAPATLTEAIQDMLIPGGKEIARASLAVGGGTAVINAAGGLDVSLVDLSISFDVTDHPVMYELFIPIATSTVAAGGTVSAFLTDELFNKKTRGNAPSSGGGLIMPPIMARGLITTPGSYTRLARFNVATGNVTIYYPIAGQNDDGGGYVRAWEI